MDLHKGMKSSRYDNNIHKNDIFITWNIRKMIDYLKINNNKNNNVK